MELLPASVNEDHRFAVGCFALLREVYVKLYSIGDRDISEGDIDNDDSDKNDLEDSGGNRRRGRRKRRRGKINNQFEDENEHHDNEGDEMVIHSPFDIDQRFEELRSPYDHLRAELDIQQDLQLSPQIMYTGLATATADLDALVQRFVFEDDHGRMKLFRMAKEYYEVKL
jgi:hypothetical protein